MIIRQLLRFMRRRLFWMTLLLAIWLFCSGQARAGQLADRLQSFPGWHQPPSLATAQGKLFYPDWMAGSWRLTTTLVDGENQIQAEQATAIYLSPQDPRFLRLRIAP